LNSSDPYALVSNNTGGGGAIGGAANGSLYPAITGVALGSSVGVNGWVATTSKSSIGVIGTVGGPGPWLIDLALEGGVGVVGDSPTGTGVIGTTNNEGGNVGNGVEGVNYSGRTGAGLYGRASTNGVAVYGENVDAANGGLAGYFRGNVDVYGTLTASIKPFRIDHPLDPAGKYLNHSSIESPDMMNVYNGNTTTNGRGRAVVRLPRYFEALNRDFKYQLTVIGGFAQAVVSQEIKSNRFVIKTDRGNVRVSWQVTGVRRDPYAEAHRIVVEVKKADAERGRYLHPELYQTKATKPDARQPIGSLSSVFKQRKDVSAPRQKAYRIDATRAPIKRGQRK
jgi:hypothetical protein